jgi:hypothetical protein
MMSRSGYTDDYDLGDGSINLWRGAVKSAFKGKRGQTFLREMLAALDGLTDKALILNDLATEDGVCAIGAVGAARGIDMSKINPEDSDAIAATFGIARAMACEIMYMNDDYGSFKETCLSA